MKHTLQGGKRDNLSGHTEQHVPRNNDDEPSNEEDETLYNNV
jgi:hypothetical protein